MTGASSGIGRATALHAAAAGDHVVVLARRAGELEDLVEECVRSGAASAGVAVADVTEDDRMAQVVARVLDEHGRIDAVLHCAGVVTYGRTEDVSAEDFLQVVSTNLLGSATLARHVIPVFREQEHGVLVLVGSLLGHVGRPRDDAVRRLQVGRARAGQAALAGEPGPAPRAHRARRAGQRRHRDLRQRPRRGRRRQHPAAPGDHARSARRGSSTRRSHARAPSRRPRGSTTP